MSLRPVAALCLKLLSLWTLIPLLDWLSNLLQILNPSFTTAMGPIGTRFFVTGTIVPLLVRLSLGVALWVFAEGIPASMVKDEEPLSHIPTPIEWQRLAFAVLGANLCVSSAEGLARSAIIAWQNAQDSLVHQKTMGAAEVIPLLVKGALGLWLLLGVRGIVRGVANFKNVGRDAGIL